MKIPTIQALSIRLGLISLLSFGISLFTVIPARGEAGPVTDDLYYFIANGELSGNIGAAFNLRDYHSRGPKDQGLAWGLMDLKYRTPELYGFKAGTWLVGAQKLWQQEQGYYDKIFTQDFDFREIYLEYTTPGEIGTIAGGRKKYKKNPSMDGDSHLGVGLSLTPIENATIYFSAINKWINNDRTDFNAKGISGWIDVSEVNDDAGDIFFALMGDLEPVNNLNILPYFEYLQDVMAVGGCEVIYEFPIAEKFIGVINGIYAYHANQVPRSIKPEYEDVQSALFHLGVASDFFSLGGGIYWLSDDQGNIMAGIFDTFDPLEKDTYYPFYDQNHAALYYIDATICFEPITVEAAFGMGKNWAHDVVTREFDLWIYWDILPSLELGGYLTWNDFSGDEALPDFIQSGSSLLLKF
jgi:hypothetical protein